MRIPQRKNMLYGAFSLCFRVRVFIALLIFGQCLAVSASAQLRQVFVDDLQADNEINKISFYSPSEGYVAFNRWIGYTTDSGRTFTKKYITLNNVNYNGYGVNLTFGFGIKGVRSVNVNTLIVYGDYGAVPAILYSTDQGNNFTLIYQSQLNTQQLAGITDMVFPQNSNIGYATEPNRIIKTTNQGKDWASVYNYINGFFDFVEAVDDNTVFAFSTQYGSRRLVKTINGGSNWVQLTVPAGQIKYAHFITASNGWLIIDNGQGGMVYYTTNGGSSWVLKNDPLVTPFSATKMKFINDSTGYALVGSFYVYKTSDSGKVWEQLPRDNNYGYLNYGHNDLQLLNKDQFWAGGGHGFLELSTNGGGTPLPKAFFKIDTTGLWKTRSVNLINYSKKNYQYKWYVNDVLISNSYHASYTHAYVNGVDSIKLVVTNGVLSDSITRYQYFSVPPLPAITSFSPATGSTGTMVTIYGNNFSNINDVQFGGTSASSFTIVSSTKITAIIGAGTTGNVSLTHLYGTFSAPGFTYFLPPSSPPPVITSFSPASGPVGTVVTIAGSNFDALPANNIVYFGDTRALVSSAASGQLTCTVPMGASYKPIFVLNTTTHLSAQSFKPFVTTFPEQVSNFAKNSFPEGVTIELGYQKVISYASSADLDNDGKTDILAALDINSLDTLIAYRNTTSNGKFSFAEPVRIGYLSRFGGSAHTYDFDGDGLPDIVGATNEIEVPVFRNTSVPGNISFEAPVKVSVIDGTQETIASDLDGDGKPDLIATGVSGGNDFGVVRNTSSPGNISFGPVISYPVRAGYTVAAGDLDNDGKNDIVAVSSLSGNFLVSCFRNTSSPGNISLVQTDVTLKGWVLPANVMLADMDGDNKLDIVIKIINDYIIGRNTSATGNVSFDFSFRASDYSSYGGSAVESLSGDDKPDFVAGNNGTDRNFAVFMNTSVPGSITQRNPVTIDGKEYANCTQTADFNNDGKADVLIAGWNDTRFTVFKNAVGAPVSFPTCSGSAKIVADYPGSAYKWQQDNGSGFVDIANNNNLSGTQASELNFVNVPASWNGYKYRCVVDGIYYSSTFVILNRNQLPADVSLTSSATSVCYGNTVTFTATDLNNSDRLVVNYLWQIDGKNYSIYYPTSSTFTASTELSNNSQVRVIATYRDDCYNYSYDTSNVIVMSVTGGPSSVSISAPVTIVCSGTAVTFTATPVNGGVNPVYQWQVNGVNAGTNSPVFTTPPLTGYSQVSVQMTTSASCVLPVTSSNTMVINVISLTTPSITIYQYPTTICPGTNVVFSSTASTTGATRHYQWKKNGQNVGVDNYAYQDNALVNGDVISLELTTNGQCEVTHMATSNAIITQINPTVTPSVTITGSTVVNKGQSSRLQATAASGGTYPAYQWQDSTGTHTWSAISAATTTSLVYTPVTTGDKIRCQLTSNAPCATTPTVVSTPLTFTINVPTAIAPVPLSGDLQIYPNPAINILVLDSLKLSDIWTTVEITDMNGRRMMTQSISNQTKVELWIEHLSKGMYVAVLRKKNGAAFYYKFVKM